ncbi:MAG: alanine racemase [Clostridia bacterium]|nr:alanine racemase [Clostridia bacterium]
MMFSKMIFCGKTLKKNFDALPTKNVCAMVKANAYGMGLKRVCKTLLGKAKFFGVATLEEALSIRKFDKQTPVLLVGVCSDFALAAANNISVTVENENQFFQIQKLKISAIKIHIKINTGMNRFGFNNKKQLKKILNKIKKNKKIVFEGFYTHFYATENKKTTLMQLKKFEKFVDLIPQNFQPIIHIGGGGVVDALEFDQYKNYMVRVGLKLYENVVKIKSQIVKIFDVRRRENVGYSGAFVAKKKTRVGIVPLGYADGINRALGGRGYVRISGKLCKIIGNVCMDSFFVDITRVACNVGDEVLVFDDAADWAKIAQTIPYEILTNLNFARMEIVEK